MKNVSYSKDVFLVLNKLAKISNEVVVTKSEDRINVCRSGSDSQIVYRLTAPSSAFDFEGDEIAFDNFIEFYRLVEAFEEPKISQTGDNDEYIVIQEKKSKVKYRVADPEALEKSPSEIDFSSPDLVFNITDTDLANLMRIKNHIKAKYITIKLNKDREISLVFTGEDHEHSFERVMKNEIETDIGDFEKKISAKHLDRIPAGEYKVSVMEEGIIQFQLITEGDFTLEIYTAVMEEQE